MMKHTKTVIYSRGMKLFFAYSDTHITNVPSEPVGALLDFYHSHILVPEPPRASRPHAHIIFPVAPASYRRRLHAH